MTTTIDPTGSAADTAALVANQETATTNAAPAPRHPAPRRPASRDPPRSDSRRAARPRARPGPRLPFVAGTGTVRPDDRRRGRGLVRLGRRGSEAPRLLLATGEHEHRPPAPRSGRRHSGAGGPAVHDRTPARQRRPLGGRPPHRRARPRRSRPRVLHQRGADANEHAIRMARLHTGRTKVLSAYRGYHGGTQLAVNVTGDPRRFPNDYSAEGVVHFMPAYQYRSYFGSTTEAEETERARATSRTSSSSRARRTSRPSSSRPCPEPPASTARPPATSRACGS